VADRPDLYDDGLERRLYQFRDSAPPEGWWPTPEEVTAHLQVFRGMSRRQRRIHMKAVHGRWGGRRRHRFIHAREVMGL
jgi:hypothetical protein